jgi:cell wall-associated NlpC family hydrolase
MATKADKYRSLALAQLGKRYIFGYETVLSNKSPRAFDCSELIQWLYYQAGYNMVDGSRYQYRACNAIKPRNGKYIQISDLRVGDLFFLVSTHGVVHHVGTYVGKGEVVEARGRAWGVVKTNLTAVRHRGGKWRRPRGTYLGEATKSVATKPTTPLNKALIKQGSTGYWVTVAKKKLNTKLTTAYKVRYGSLNIKSSVFGPDMTRAVIAFQKRMFPRSPSEWDGVIGPKTWKALG